MAEPSDPPPSDQRSGRPSDEPDPPPLDDGVVPRRMFLAIGAFMVFLAVVYWFGSYEDAGTVLLALAAVLALWFGTFLWLQQRRVAAARPDDGDDAALGGGEYLPHASAWPFAIGLGAATFANGLVLGIWVIVPGVALLALGIGGFVHQTRHRL